MMCSRVTLSQGVEHLRHLLCAHWIFDQHASLLQHHLQRINNLVERGGCSTFLPETNKAEVCVSPVLENSVELG